jgi:membrane protease YdiL (CAAX protease family)
MILPATFFYGMVMSNLPVGVFQWYFYFLAKTILFLLPGLVIIKLRKHRLSDFGITIKRLKLSLLLGFGILIITSITNAIIFSLKGSIFSPPFLTWSIPLFFDAFNEEFMFRGIFFLFALKNTKNLSLAYIVSIILAFAWHPEFTMFRMIPVFIQGTLLCYLLYKSKNIFGAWISHGINRTLASLLTQLLTKL